MCKILQMRVSRLWNDKRISNMVSQSKSITFDPFLAEMAKYMVLSFLNVHRSPCECLMSTPVLSNRNTRFYRFWKWAGGATNESSLTIRRIPPSTTRWQQCRASELNGADWKSEILQHISTTSHLFVPQQLHRVLL